MTIDWNSIIATALNALIPIILIVIGKLIISYLEKKGATEEQIALVKELGNIVSIAVKAMNQKVVDALKAEGGFTAEKQAEVKADCLVLIESMLTDTMKTGIEGIYSSIETLLDTMLEAAVWEAKQEKSTDTEATEE